MLGTTGGAGPRAGPSTRWTKSSSRLPSEDTPLLKQLMEQLALRTVDVKVVPDLFQYVTLYGGLEEFGGLPLIGLQGGPLQGWSLVAKRVFDVFLSLLVLALLSPVLVVVALVVKLTSRGPILFRQERMGMDGRTFRIFKFRTMRTDAEVGGSHHGHARETRGARRWALSCAPPPWTSCRSSSTSLWGT